jgi:hypothetical protein
VGVGGGARVAMRGCVGDAWWPGGHLVRWHAVRGVVVGAGALVDPGARGGDGDWAEHIGGGGALLGWSPSAVGLHWLRLSDGLAHPSRATRAPGAAVGVDVLLAGRDHLWPSSVWEPGWPQSWQWRSCIAASWAVARFTSG